MILLDTNVVSEPLKPAPDLGVITWIDAQAIEALYLSSVPVAELRFGIATMPASKRRNTLHRRLEQEVLPLFASRVLAFDLDASQTYAKIMAVAKKAGKAIGMADAYVAAIAAASGFVVATRDTGPFAAAGLNTVNPWQRSVSQTDIKPFAEARN